ncbi:MULTISPECIES: hypothetical protein [Bradyrhizobium]|uniref:hypothetical protein n=1 Tax=Bradyrhizobium elkanii TaxID=29448 RepID=UPI0004151B7D|nr:hypothetical protein [Bradyrhizobium elkanii]
MNEQFKLAGWLVLGLSAVAASFLFEGLDNFLRWPLIIGGAVFVFLSTMERHKREMREVIKDEVYKVMSAQFEINRDRHEETVRRLAQLKNKLDELSDERR